ncbi:hypothetical protein [Mesorhizobium xinjiangense]|nr:hypothetical protein [Mesorhizobium xinjiangense]
MTLKLAIKSVSTVVVLAGLSGIAFAMWAENGPRVLMAMAETGLSWCF